MSAGRPWEATVTVRAPHPVEAEWLASALGPEASREVPRASATVARDGEAVTVSIAAADAGAMRAALNTYLGWIALSLATASASAGRPEER